MHLHDVFLVEAELGQEAHSQEHQVHPRVAQQREQQGHQAPPDHLLLHRQVGGEVEEHVRAAKEDLLVAPRVHVAAAAAAGSRWMEFLCAVRQGLSPMRPCGVDYA